MKAKPKRAGKILKVGLTGGVASGKTEALGMFKKLGVPTLSSDEIVKDLMRPGRPAVRRIRAHFGPDAVRAGGGVCREFLRERVLADPKELDWLERMLHPGVRRSIRDFFAVQKKTARRGAENGLKAREAAPVSVLVVEVPLLFENGFYKLFDRTVAVQADAASAERRAAGRGMPAELYEFFSKRQWSPAKKAKAADVVIVNNKSLKELERAVTGAYKKFLDEGSR